MNEIGPGQIIWPLLTILVSVSAVAAVFLGSRRRPPLAEELAKSYVTKKDCENLRQDINDRIDREIRLILSANVEQSKKLDALIATTGQTARDTDRSLGRIEGKIEGLQGALDQHIKEHHDH